MPLYMVYLMPLMVALIWRFGKSAILTVHHYRAIYTASIVYSYSTKIHQFEIPPIALLE